MTLPGTNRLPGDETKQSAAADSKSGTGTSTKKIESDGRRGAPLSFTNRPDDSHLVATSSPPDLSRASQVIWEATELQPHGSTGRVPSATVTDGDSQGSWLATEPKEIGLVFF